jgi:hypothetical protein
MLGALAAAGKNPSKAELLPAKYLNVNVKAFELGC